MTIMTKARLALNVGRTADMLKKGYSITDIAAKLKVSEVTVKEYIGVIKKAEENRAKMAK